MDRPALMDLTAQRVPRERPAILVSTDQLEQLVRPERMDRKALTDPPAQQERPVLMVRKGLMVRPELMVPLAQRALMVRKE